MKKTFIKRLAAFILFAMIGVNLFSQGFYVYTKDGQRQDYASENVDSIVFYEKATEDIKLSEEERMFVGYWINNNVPNSIWREKYPNLFLTEDGRSLIRYQESLGIDHWKTIVSDEGEWAYNKSVSTLATSISNWQFAITLSTDKSWSGAYVDIGNKVYTQSLRKASRLEVADFIMNESGLIKKSETPFASHTFRIREIDENSTKNFTFEIDYWYASYPYEYWKECGKIIIKNPYNFSKMEVTIEGRIDDESHKDVVTWDLCKITEKNDGKTKIVDLGLSVKWADRNVDAVSPEDIGGMYAWGEINTKNQDRYNKNYYKWCYTDGTIRKYNLTDNLVTLTSEDDVATVKWGNDWRMPTEDEVQELCTKCIWKFVNYNGIDGFIITGLNSNRIFLPKENYWSATTSGGEDYNYGGGSALEFCRALGSTYRCFGHAVRPVTD